MPLISVSEAELWDLIILVDMENGVILPGQSPIIAGIIVDHASKPVSQVHVNIRSGQESIFTVTDENGQFRAELGSFDRMPGTHLVNVIGNSIDGKTGIGNTEFLVKGDVTQFTALEEKLSTPEAKKYLKADPEEFARDPIGSTLFKYYQKMQQEYLEKKKINEQLADKQIFIENQKTIADELKHKAVNEFNPSFGIFSGYKYEDYIKSLDPKIKDTIINQLNFTKSLFEEARQIKEEIILNGGTQEEAMQAYFEHISVTKEQLNSFGEEQNQTQAQIENGTNVKINQDITEKSDTATTEDTLQEDLEGTDIKVETEGRNIFVNVNGTILEYFVNATGIYRVEN